MNPVEPGRYVASGGLSPETARRRLPPVGANMGKPN
jgi:hypothetical protein